MKPLTERQASRCENAKNRRCRCRCHGVLHGAARIEARQLFLLSEDDLHRVAPAKER